MNEKQQKLSKKKAVTKSKLKNLDIEEDVVYYNDSEDEKNAIRELGLDYPNYNFDEFNSY